MDWFQGRILIEKIAESVLATMPTQKPKKSKSEKVKIKVEPQEIKPLSHYVDDRLELIKQAFSCLKPKTIKAITPKFLQNKSLEDIQEQCLDEVLGISNKRLLAIINNSKCPTDTESSDDENDVERIVEHISLDEISSDEEMKAAKKKPVVKKEYSVLELLELQARARAIRSQLALEPVTKIELEEDEPETADQSSKEKEPNLETEKKSKSTKSVSSQSKLKNGNPSTSAPIKKVKEKIPDVNPGIKIKRNFRKRSEDKEEPKEKIKADHDRARESSPEVMTILASPETLCISSDEEEKVINGTKSPEKVSVTAPESVPEKAPTPVPEEPPEEGEICDETTSDAVTQDNVDEQIIEPECTESNKIVAIEEETLSKPEEIQPDKLESVNDDIDLQAEIDDKGEDDKMDDDCIDLECNDLMEDEPELSDKPIEESPNKQPPNETVNISDSSSEYENEEKRGDSASNDSKSESWNSRWLGSSKVSKILAESRINNSIRRKLKSSKLKKKMLEEEEAAVPSPVAEASQIDKDVEMDNVEVGSVSHYQKIIETEKPEDEEPKA